MTNTTPNSLFAFLNLNFFFYLAGKRTNGNLRLVLLFTEIAISMNVLFISFHFFTFR